MFIFFGHWAVLRTVTITTSVNVLAMNIELGVIAGQKYPVFSPGATNRQSVYYPTDQLVTL